MLRKHPAEWLFLLVILCASVLRFYHYASWSLSNDELSALYRLEYKDFHNLIQFGVMKGDFHPSGVQVFLYYWVKILGNSVAVVRFPFVLAGIFSVGIAFLIARRWFGEVTALFSASAMAMLEYFLLYSQLARPYSPGLLFSLATVWFWTKILFDQKPHWLNYAGFSLSVALAAYSHNYSFLFVVIVGITGFFYLKKTNRIKYILSGIAAAILYLPNLKIFLYQFAIGGVGGEGGWLGKPHPGWITDYLLYAFNGSLLIITIFILFFLISIILRFKKNRFNRFYLLTLLFFLLPFLIGYFYSILRNPVLQYSILLFSFPFLLFFLFSFLPQKINAGTTTLLVIFLFTGIFSTVSGKKYYSTQHFGEFKDVAAKLCAWDEQFGEENVAKALQANNVWYVNYYLKQLHHPVTFVQTKNDGNNDFRKLKQAMDTSSTSYFAYVQTKSVPEEVYDIIQTKYPYVVEDHDYSGLSRVTLFSKKAVKPVAEKEVLFSLKTDMENAAVLGTDSVLQCTSCAKSGRYSLKLDPLHEYGLNIIIPVQKYSGKIPAKIKVSLWAMFPDTSAKVILVVDISSADKKPIFWAGREIQYFLNPNTWNQGFFRCNLPAELKEGDLIKIYLWNPQKKTIFADDFIIDFE